MTQVGGASGLVYSAVPVLVFVIAASLASLIPAVTAAVAAAGLILVWRLIRRESTQPAVSGFSGVVICAAIAYLMGESKGYFLLGIVMSLLGAVVCVISILIRQPAVGYLWSWIGGRDRRWRTVRRAVYTFDIATAAWVLVFASRFLVQGFLYDTDRTGWLAAARITMGVPLTAAAALVTYLAIKAVRRMVPESAPGPVAEPSRD